MKKLLPLVLSFVWTIQVLAMPAYHKMIKLTQADGSVVAARLLGDEHRHLLVTEDGYPLAFNTLTGNYEYATITNLSLTPSGLEASQVGRRPEEAKQFLATIDKNCVGEFLAYEPSTTTPNMMKRVVRMNGVPTTGSHKALVVLVNYKDTKFSMSSPVAYYDDFFHKEGFSKNGAQGCVYEWYAKASNFLYDPDFDVLGPVTVKGNSTEYAGGVNTVMAGIETTYKMILEVIDLIDEEVDFSEYDTDGDGVCDNIYCIYAGYGQNETGVTSQVWPHSNYLSQIGYNKDQDYSVTRDGVKIDRFTVSNEMNATTDVPTGIGTFVHEFGHVLGLADHYSTSGATMNMPFEWDVMANGSYNNNQNTPPLFTAFERYSLGWMELTELTATTDTIISLPFLEEGIMAYRVSVPNKDNEYFVIENRQQKGWDKYVPGHGALVWHIDENQAMWDANMVNYYSNHPRVDVVEASGNVYQMEASSGDTFPGSKNVLNYTFDAWNNVKDVFGFADVKEESGVVKILLDGTDYRLASPSLKVENIAGTTATLRWTAPEYARTYNIYVSRGEEQILKKENYEGNSLSLTSLEAETEYTVKIMAVNSKLSSDMTVESFSTTKKQVDEEVVVATSATDVTATSFTANWEKVESAEAYEVTLLTRQLTGKTECGTGFTNATAEDYLLPEGWSTDCTTAPSSQNYGEELPSFRFNTDMTYLQASNPGNKLQYLRFWHRSNNKKNYVSVEQLVGGEWSVVCDSIGGGAGEEKTENITLNDADAVRITYHHSLGYFLVDDVYVGYTYNEYTPVDSQQTTETSLTFTGLDAAKQYSYKVRAKAGSKYSQESDIIDVNLITDGISTITHHPSPITSIYDLKGRKISNLFDGNLPKGIYIVNGVKIVVK